MSRKDKLYCYCKECQQKYRAKDQKHIKIRQKEYSNTIRGILNRKYHHIKWRCENPNAYNYNRYGGRGIKCLFKSSQEFADYVINELKADPRGLEIDRINNDGHYERGNIRFVTRSENCKNREE